jgi:hypothetical protein
MVFNATFNNISAISWQSDLLVEETGETGENHQAYISGIYLYYFRENNHFYISMEMSYYKDQILKFMVMIE